MPRWTLIIYHRGDYCRVRTSCHVHWPYRMATVSGKAKNGRRKCQRCLGKCNIRSIAEPVRSMGRQTRRYRDLVASNGHDEGVSMHTLRSRYKGSMLKRNGFIRSTMCTYNSTQTTSATKLQSDKAAKRGTPIQPHGKLKWLGHWSAHPKDLCIIHKYLSRILSLNNNALKNNQLRTRSAALRKRCALCCASSGCYLAFFSLSLSLLLSLHPLSLSFVFFFF